MQLPKPSSVDFWSFRHLGSEKFKQLPQKPTETRDSGRSGCSCPRMPNRNKSMKRHRNCKFGSISTSLATFFLLRCSFPMPEHHVHNTLSAEQPSSNAPASSCRLPKCTICLQHPLQETVQASESAFNKSSSQLVCGGALLPSTGNTSMTIHSTERHEPARDHFDASPGHPPWVRKIHLCRPTVCMPTTSTSMKFLMAKQRISIPAKKLQSLLHNQPRPGTTSRACTMVLTGHRHLQIQHLHLW